MPLLKAEPSRAIQSTEELFAIARKLEHEAAQSYAALAARARTEGIPELAPLFEQLARDEREHEHGIEAWAESEIHKQLEPAIVAWQLPATFDMEAAAEVAGSRLASAYKILSIAVRNEERAFEFWTYVAAQAPSDEIRRLAERMARGELEHVALVRRARRRAYHAERAAPSSASAGPDKLAEAAMLEGLLAERLDRLAERLEHGQAIRGRELAAQSRAMQEEAHGGSPRRQEPPRTETDEVAMAERLVEDYLEVGERSHDEAMIAKAQSLAARAIARLAWLRTVLQPSDVTLRPRH